MQHRAVGVAKGPYPQVHREYRPFPFTRYSPAFGLFKRSVQFRTTAPLFGVQLWTELAGCALVIRYLIRVQGPGSLCSKGFRLYISAGTRNSPVR